MSKRIKSLTHKNVWGSPKKEDIGKVLYNVFGVATGVITVNTKYGESFGLKGDFVAVNAETGEIFESDAFFPPANFVNDMRNHLENQMEVEFKASVQLIESDKNERGYAYVMKEPVTEERKNRLIAMREAAEASSQLLLSDNSGKKKSDKKAA